MSQHHPSRRVRTRPIAITATVVLAVAALGAGSSAAAPPGTDDWSPASSIEADGGAVDAFNTSSLDGCPFVARDDRTFFLASTRPGGLGGIDIWMSTRSSADEPWRAPVNLGAPVNSSADDFCPTMGRDGHQFFFVSTRAGGCGGADIYTARLHNRTGIDDVEHLGCDLNSPADEASPFPLPVSGDGLVLYFSSTRAGGYSPEPPGSVVGDSDVYIAHSVAGSFGPAQIAPGVNSVATDGQPNVRRDGLELVFFSTREGGFGQADLYSATRGRTDDAWSTPVNLGSNVNTSFAESRPSLSWDARTLYFGSTRPGEGSSDIYVTHR